MKKKNIFIHISMWLCVLIIVLSSRYWHNSVKQEIIDYISQQTIIKEIEKELQEEYTKAAMEIRAKLDDYFQKELGISPDEWGVG